MSRQRQDVPQPRRLSMSDLRRITNYVDESMFGHECVLWKGYVTNHNKPEKKNYVNFFFNRKKQSLHRLLYENFVGELTSGDYIKFRCSNPGMCCNVNHLSRHQYHKKATICRPVPTQKTLQINKGRTRLDLSD